ncbi:hypothetical protein Taro_023897 [Colocasia esculenta]|uniref:Uncharacterized protein n=1 Tax=Colocasia esculenta TaxID=4460 RepID=A0A843V4Y3_COLES|nr:hypothetical protein [Colocasia esculenta]
MFHGEYDLDMAESWTHELERIFETMECTEEDQQPVQYAQQLPQYQYPPQQQAPRQQQWGQYQQQAQQFSQPQQYHPYQRQQKYPQQQQQQPQQASQHGRGRMMALTREQAEASNLVIGTLPILGRAARVLVDPSASLCFASEEFYESLACHAPERQCELLARLYALQLCDFDVILSMDWLEAHSAVVDCQRKTVRFRIPGEPVLCFRGGWGVRPGPLGPCGLVLRVATRSMVATCSRQGGLHDKVRVTTTRAIVF